MKSKKLLLTIKDLKDLGLIGKRKKKSRRKRKADKKMVVPNSVISGVRSEFIGPTFGTQINRTTDLQNENIRLQNEKLLDNVKNSENQTKLLLALANENEGTQTDLDNFRKQANRYKEYVDKSLLTINDSFDVSKSGGSYAFNSKGDPNKKKSQGLNDNEITYGRVATPNKDEEDEKDEDNKINTGNSPMEYLFNFFTPASVPTVLAGGQKQEPEPEWVDEETKPEPKKKNISKLTKEEMVVRLRELGYQESVIGLNKFELYSKLKVLQPRKKRSTKTKT